MKQGSAAHYVTPLDNIGGLVPRRRDPRRFKHAKFFRLNEPGATAAAGLRPQAPPSKTRASATSAPRTRPRHSLNTCGGVAPDFAALHPGYKLLLRAKRGGQRAKRAANTSLAIDAHFIACRRRR